MSQLRLTVPIVAAVMALAGSFMLGQKRPEADPRAGSFLSTGADTRANTKPAAAAHSSSATQQDQDEVLPGSGSYSQSAPFYTVNDGFMTMLMLNNATKAGFLVKVTLYSLDGVPAELPSIHLKAHETKEVDLNEWVAGLGAQYVTGSVRLEYQSIPYGLGAMVMMVNERQSIEVDVLARPPWEFKSNRLEAMWWRPEQTTEVHYAIQNTADAQVRGKLILTSSHGHAIKSVELDMAPHQTRVYKLHELLIDADRTFIDKVGGISIEHQGKPGDLRAQSFILRRSIGFSASLQFEDPKAVVDSHLEGAGILIGSEPTVGHPESFSGHLLLRNLSAESVTVKAQVQRNTIPNSMPDLRLEPGEAREVLVPADSAYSTGKDPGAAGVALEYSGKSGDVLAYWFSVGASGSLVVETPLRNPASLPQAGSNPWSLEGDYSSVLYVKNTSAKPSSFVTDIFYRGGYYMIGMKTVEAGETTAIDIRTLRDEQIADVNGHKLPPHLATGQINWRTRNGEPRLIGRVNTMSVSKGLANNMSCSVCCSCPSSQNVALQPGSWAGLMHSTFSFTPLETDASNCGSQTYPLSPSSLSWSSTNPNVASVNQSATVSCLAAGSTLISGSGTFTNTDIDNSQPIPIEACPPCVSSFTQQNPGAGVTVLGITNVQPSPFVIGTSGIMTIAGSGFYNRGTASVTFDGVGIATSGTPTVVDDSHITVNYSVSCSAGSQNVTVSFPPQGGVTPRTDPFPVSVGLPAAPTPTIMFGGSNITGSTQSVVVGQQIALSSPDPSLPACMSISSRSWSTPPGTAVGGYSASTASGSVTALPGNTNSSFTFFWVDPGNSRNMTFQYTMSSGGGTVNSPVASATFNVNGVTSPSMAVQNSGLLTIHTLTGCAGVATGPWLEYGDFSGNAPGCPPPPTGTQGITFTPSGTQPDTGSFVFVQLINSDTLSQTPSGGTAQTCPATAGLDTTYPYIAVINGVASDSPLKRLVSTNSAEGRSFKATMYLMWQSNSANSIPVPLGSVTWSFSENTTQLSPGWTAPTGSSNAGAFTGSSAFPTWAGLSTRQACQ